jgi:membrane-associated HD superfamily phosphohydrolase
MNIKTNKIMTQLEINRIKKVFSEEYFDLGILRWMERNKNVLKTSFGISFIAVLSIAILWSSWPLAIWAFAFIGIITIGGLDHFIVGLSLKRILKKLESQDINISLTELLSICSDIIPQ